jgi:hypothetical protein
VYSQSNNKCLVNQLFLYKYLFCFIFQHIRVRAIRRAGKLLEEFDVSGQRNDLPVEDGLNRLKSKREAAMSEHRQRQVVLIAIYSINRDVRKIYDMFAKQFSLSYQQL